MSMKMKARKPFPYAGRKLKVGDEFVASRRDGKVLEVSGMASKQEQDAEEPSLETVVASPRRGYRRRDMRATP